jgi:hypothetical protein
MDVQTALDLLRPMTYKPAWRFEFEAVDESTIKFSQYFATPDSGVQFAEMGYPRQNIGFWFEDITVTPEMTSGELLASAWSAVLAAEVHESSEFFRMKVAGRAPFHPHQDQGQLAWDVHGADILAEVNQRVLDYFVIEREARAEQAAAKEAARTAEVKELQAAFPA